MRCYECPDYPDDCRDYSKTVTVDGKVYMERPCGERELICKVNCYEQRMERK